MSMAERDPEKKPYATPIIVLVSSDCTAGLIGKAGAAIGEIQDKSNTKIDICKRRDLADKPIMIHGADEDKRVALEMIIANLRDNPNNKGRDGKNDSFWIAVPTCTTGTVVGAQGATIMKIQSGSGAKIDVEKERFKGKTMVNVHLKGEDHQIIDATMQIDDIVKYSGKDAELEEAYKNIEYFVKRSREGEDAESYGTSRRSGGGGYEEEYSKGKGKGGMYDDWWYWMGPSDWWGGKGWGKGDMWGGKGDMWGGKGGKGDWGMDWGKGGYDNKRGRDGGDEYRPSKAAKQEGAGDGADGIPIQLIMEERQVSAVFGHGSAFTDQVSSTSGASIEVDKQSYRGKKGIAITGEQFSKQNALDAIFGAIEDKNGQMHEAEFFIPEDYVKVVIGRGGQKIGDIESNSQTKITMCKVGSQGPNEIPGSIQIKGTRDGICQAVARIDEIINDGSLAVDGKY